MEMKSILLIASFLFLSSICTALVPSAAVIVHTACGFVAGSAGAIAAYPIDYVKSQLQTEAGRAKYSGGLQAAYEIVREDGFLALYRRYGQYHWNRSRKNFKTWCQRCCSSCHCEPLGDFAIGGRGNCRCICGNGASHCHKPS